jgi:hypothetical protein
MHSEVVDSVNGSVVVDSDLDGMGRAGSRRRRSRSSSRSRQRTQEEEIIICAGQWRRRDGRCRCRSRYRCCCCCCCCCIIDNSDDTDDTAHPLHWSHQWNRHPAAPYAVKCDRNPLTAVVISISVLARHSLPVIPTSPVNTSSSSVGKHEQRPAPCLDPAGRLRQQCTLHSSLRCGWRFGLDRFGRETCSQRALLIIGTCNSRRAHPRRPPLHQAIPDNDRASFQPRNSKTQTAPAAGRFYRSCCRSHEPALVRLGCTPFQHTAVRLIGSK